MSKFDKSKDIKDEQSLNIKFIDNALDVLKLDKFNETNEEHLLNKEVKNSTFDISRLVKSKDIKDEHPENILEQLLRFVVFELNKVK